MNGEVILFENCWDFYLKDIFNVLNKGLKANWDQIGIMWSRYEPDLKQIFGGNRRPLGYNSGSYGRSKYIGKPKAQ